MSRSTQTADTAPPPRGAGAVSRSGATILGVSGPELTADEQAFLREADPFGFILFSRNVDSPAQLVRLTAALRETVGRDALVMVDQEGGRVQRLRAPHWTDWPAPLAGAPAGPEAMALRYRLLGRELRAVGIDADAAPGLDIARPDTHPFLYDRCLGHDAGTVATLGRAAAEGLLAAGVLPCVKHMPGHGRARVDSHLDLPVVDAPLEELAATDFAPFAALADLPLGMTAHIRFTALDDAPATASGVVIGLIRERIGFDGLLMTDDIGMNALSGTIGQRAAAAIAAGCDLVLHCSGDLAGMADAAAHAGRLSDAAARRAAAALARRGGPDGADERVLRDRLATLEQAVHLT